MGGILPVIASASGFLIINKNRPTVFIQVGDCIFVITNPLFSLDQLLSASDEIIASALAALLRMFDQIGDVVAIILRLAQVLLVRLAAVGPAYSLDQTALQIERSRYRLIEGAFNWDQFISETPSAVTERGNGLW
jgi:hypothetical protein